MDLKRADAARVWTRRGFVAAGAAAAAAMMLRRGAAPVEAKDAAAKEVTVVEFNDAGQRGNTVTLAVVVKSDDAWRQQLGGEAYEVTRQAGTERPYSGVYWNNHEKGLYRCVCCGTALFNSETKFESGTGWPSFWEPVAKENVREISDSSLGMERTEVRCRLCEAHLGHVFDDGPQPTGLRYCMNSVALRFVKFG
jgi:peptide-methionine (R)-S-oxide reductase